MEQNNDNQPGKKKAFYDDSRQGTERMMRKETAGAAPSSDDEKKLDEDIHTMIVKRENAERLAENLADHLTSEITGFADMMKASRQEIKGFADSLKANTQNVRLVEEKVARLSRDVDDIRKSGAAKAFDERMSRLEALCNVINEKLSKQEEICGTLNGMVHSEHDELAKALNAEHDELAKALNAEHDELTKALNEKISRQDEMGRALMAVVDDFKARMDDYPTRGEIDPIWKEAETVILDGMNRQRGDLKALIAALDEDYRDGAISEKTYRETREKTLEKMSVLEDKIKRFVEAAADRGRAVAERQAAPTTEKEKLADAKLAEIKKREERLSMLEKKLEDSNGFIGGRLAELEKKISELSRKGDGTERLSRLETRMGELGGRIEELKTALSSADKRMMGVEKELHEERSKPMPRPDAREQQQQQQQQRRQGRPAAGGLLGRILGIERESGEITPMMAPVMAGAEKIKIELEAPFAPAIMSPLPYGPEEKRLKAELESLEAMLGRLKEQRQNAGGHEDARSKLMGQRAELEGLLKMAEKKHAEGAIENPGYADIRQRTLERLSMINELLLGQNK